MSDKSTSENASLRKRAESHLRKTPQDIQNMPSGDIEEIISELQVYQIELQMQNEELRNTQHELELSRDRYHHLYDFAPIGYITFDRNGTIVESNLMACTQFGVSQKEIIGQRIQKFVRREDQDSYHLHAQKVLNGSEQQICELTLIKADGTAFCAQLHSVAAAKPAGTIRSAISDITERKSMERELIATRNQAQAANRAKSYFLANMSHEIRTPLNAIIGIGHILQNSEPLTRKQHEFIDTLQLSSDSLLTLINELLDITKIESSTLILEKLEFNLPDLLNNITKMMGIKAKEKRLEIKLEIEDMPANYIGDSFRIRQILLSLISNAIKFTERGVIKVQAKSVSPSAGDPTVIFKVTDSGIGIPEDKHALIFDMFTQADASTTRKYGGTGLGLSISKKLVEMMKGRITVESVKGMGSTFKVEIPLQLSKKQELSSPMHQESRVFNGKFAQMPRILLVEDHHANILIATTMLEYFLCDYDVATCGMEAIEKFNQNNYSLILMDVQMPDIDGYEVTRQLRLAEAKTGHRTCIIAMTAHALQGDRERCLKAGMDDYISKPFNPEDLYEKLHYHLSPETDSKLMA